MRSRVLKRGPCTSHSSTPLSHLPPDPSWEIGTLTEALLEYSWPQISVFNNAAPIPPAKDLYTSDYPVDVINIATTCAPSPQSLGLAHDTSLFPQYHPEQAQQYFVLSTGYGSR